MFRIRMKPYSLLLGVFCIGVGSGSADASTGVPKLARVMTDLSAPPRVATISEMNLKFMSGKCVTSPLADGSAVLRDVNLRQPVTVTIGSEAYEAFGSGWISYKKNDASCPLEASEIHYLRINIAHKKMRNLRLSIVFNFESNELSIAQLEGTGLNGFGEIVETF